ncbi:MAG TPA: retroviral-like aspartic protease family protein [Sphingomicrobium sp.]
MPLRLSVFSLALLAAGPALGNPPRTTEMQAVSGPAEIDKTTQTEDVRFRNDGYERMTVPVQVSGTGPYRFLVDTGADRTAISRDLARKLNLKAGEDQSLHSIGGVSTVATADVPGLQLTRKVVNVTDAPLLERANMGADGILGTDSLSSQRILFDFQNQTMAIVPSKSRDAADEPGSIVVTASRRNGRLIVTEARANNRAVTVVLDTGAQVSIGNNALRQRLMGKRPFDESRRIELHSVTGDVIHGEWMLVRELEMGGVTLRDLAIVFADAHTFDTLNLNDRPSLLLGMNAMRAFKKVSIDFANKKLRVVLPERSELDLRLASARL